MRSVVRIEVIDMVIGSAQNGYVREALKVLRETREELDDLELIGNIESINLIKDNLKRIEEQLTEAVKYGRDLFQEAG